MRKPLRKAVLPVAGLGTRFLPATKQMAKEMLPVVDKPLIQYAVEEARAAGIEQFCFVTGRGKTMLVDQFDVAYELERTLTERNKTKELAMLHTQALPPGSIVSTRQQVPLGLGHAIWCARAFIGNEPFAILLPDDLMQCEVSCTKQLADAYMETGGNVVAIEEVPMARVSSYGVIAPGATTGKLVEVKGLVEKPRIEEAPSNLTVIGRYVRCWPGHALRSRAQAEANGNAAGRGHPADQKRVRAPPSNLTVIGRYVLMPEVIGHL